MTRCVRTASAPVLGLAPRYQSDAEAILATRRDNGADHWATPDRRLSKGGPFSTLEAPALLAELGVDPAHEVLLGAVELLLDHWVSRAPLGPCHFGIGTLFMQVEYPFMSYNLFGYVHVLSSYDQARNDPRFREALVVLESRLVNGQIVPERVHRRLADLTFCRRGQPSELATARYRQILSNVANP